MIEIVVFTAAFAPVWTLVIGIVVVLLADLLLRERAHDVTVLLTTLILVATAGIAAFVAHDEVVDTDLFEFGDFFLVFTLFGLLSSIIVVFSAWKDMDMELDIGVFFSLLLLANIGGILIAASRNFVPLYLGYELVSIPTYAMVAFRKKNRNAAESGMKIFLLGALSSAFIIYGLAMYYGATGSFAFGATMLEGAETLRLASVALIAAGCSFKIGLVPFHFWIPDVYAGAPSSVVNFLAASSKKMAFAFVFQVFFFGMATWYETWGVLFAVLAAASMILGNVAATIQDRVMRILAYSTVAQAGYIAIAIASYGAASLPGMDTAGIQETAFTGIIFHITAHILMKGAAIMAVLVVIVNFGDDHIEKFRGLLHKSPLVGGSLALAMFSLMGIPPLAGFFGKYFLFLSAVEADLVWLAVIGIVGSAISIYYYGRVIRIMADKPENEDSLKVHPGLSFMLVVLSVLTVVLSVFGETFVTYALNIVS